MKINSRTIFTRFQIHFKKIISICKANIQTEAKSNWISICGESYAVDSWYNLTPRVLECTKHRLHNNSNNPLCLIKQRVADFMFKIIVWRCIVAIAIFLFIKRHVRRTTLSNEIGSPLFSMYDQLSPVVSCSQNFDSLLIDLSHPSRSRKDTYYVNKNTLLRSHTSAHQFDLINSGLDAFMVVGDVYRRDQVDSKHYPIFHQLEGVRLFKSDELFFGAHDLSESLRLFEKIPKSVLSSKSQGHFLNVLPSNMLPCDRQPQHTMETLKLLEFNLKNVLEELAKSLFGSSVKYRWVDGYFPFTHPSWELEIKSNVDDENDDWVEMLGCGIMRQEILERAGVFNKVGYAFGLGLERWAMKLYNIPDIRLFWSADERFLEQFRTDDIYAPIQYKPISVFPPCILDASFWINYSTERCSDRLNLSSQTIKDMESVYENNNSVAEGIDRDFCDHVRQIAGDLVEKVTIVDQYTDPKTGRISLCYRLVYRDHYRTLTMDEIGPLHKRIIEDAAHKFNLSIR